MKKKLDILYEDKYLLIVNKPYNLLCISTDKEKEKTLYHEVYTYLKQKNKNNMVFIVHRLDKETSGIVVFAKDINVKNVLQNNWDVYAKERVYTALLEGNCPDFGQVKSYLKETKTMFVYSSKDESGKLAITNYKKIKSNDICSLVEINIKTGRKNQIRVHMKDIGYPILGDTKYGNKSNLINRMALHSSKLILIHPITKQELIIESKIPIEFDIIK